MARRYFIGLALLLFIGMPAALVVDEYARYHPYHAESLPYLGAHVESASQGNIVWYSESTWARLYVRWDEIEPTPGGYTWNPKLDADIAVLKSRNAQILLTIITTPDWASQHPELRCSPPNRQHLDDFAGLVNAVIDRYQPQAVELTNEPEIPYTVIGNLHKWMGCWGPEGDYYAEMLKVVYPQVKSVHPQIIVVAGSLMLDDSMQSFWDDVLAAGASGNYDAVSFHVYTYYPLNEVERVSAKIRFLRELGETAPLWLSETSMLCLEQYTDCGPDFQIAQAEYFNYITENYQRLGLDKVFWYTLANNHWRHSDLVEWDVPSLSWYRYRSANSSLNHRFSLNE